MYRAIRNRVALAKTERTAEQEGTTQAGPGTVRVYWRPGCPYCASLRRGLDRGGVPAEWVSIWEDPAAAARVRDITGGNETVPTVLIGDQAMVNPTAGQVIAVLNGHPDAGPPG